MYPRLCGGGVDTKRLVVEFNPPTAINMFPNMEGWQSPIGILCILFHADSGCDEVSLALNRQLAMSEFREAEYTQVSCGKLSSEFVPPIRYQ